MRRQWIKLIVVASCWSALAAVGALVWWQFPWLSSPTYGLKLAGGPTGTDGQKFFAAFVREAAEEYPRIRFEVIPVGSSDATGKALLDGSADLAILRSDDPVAGQGRTLVIVRKLLAAFLTGSNSTIENPRELITKKVGVLEGTKDDRLLSAITDFYGFKKENIVAVARADLGKAISEKRVAALLVVGSVNEGLLREAIAAVRKATKREPSLLDIEEAEAFAKRYPLYETADIPKGTFVGAPPEPAEDVNTVSVTVRLVSRASLADRTAGELTRVILATKAKLLASMPAVAQIEAPETEEVSVLPLHPGAVAYLKGEQKGLYALAEENLYNVMLLGGLVASAAGWTVSRFRRQKPDANQAALTRLAELRRSVNTGTMQPRDVDRELAEITGILADQVIAQNLEPNQFLASSAIIEQVRAQSRTTSQPGPATSRAQPSPVKGI